MAILTTDDITAADRRKAVLQHADLTGVAYLPSNAGSMSAEERQATIAAALDKKIENGDDLAKTWLQETEASRTLCTLSNLLTAWLIGSGIGGSENAERCRQLKDMAMKIVEIHKGKGEAQNVPTTLLSTGITGTSISGQNTGTF